MNHLTEPNNQTKVPKHGFGHGLLSNQIVTRIRKHIADGLGDPAHSLGIDKGLTVGIMGSWGSGKSQLLDSVHQHFVTSQPSSETQTARQPIVVPVLFNAWRYERDPNLITPLLQTLRNALQNELTLLEGEAKPLPATETAKKSWLGSIKNLISFTGRAAQSFAAMSSVELELTVKGDFIKTALSSMVPIPAPALKLLTDNLGNVLEGKLKLALNPKDAIDTWHASKPNTDKASQAASESTPSTTPTIEPEAASYYNFEQQLHKLTCPQDPNASRCYLLFLVDDLDRCLPEKALEMLETIKLFFNLPACCFVIALDDDVIERGVLHRYRDYLFHHKQPAHAQAAATNHAHHPTELAPQLPITGSEYLEKIIQIPIRLSQPTGAEAEELLRERFPDLFDHRTTYERHKVKAKEEDETAANKLASASLAERLDHRKLHEATKPTRTQSQRLFIKAQQQRDLCALFEHAVPPQPRKLLRAAEALRLARATTPPDSPAQAMLQARLVIWQLFAPELFRFCQRKPERFRVVANWHWMANQHTEDLQWLCGQREALDPNGLISQTLPKGNDLQMLMRLRDFVVNSYRQRSEFDLGRLFRTPNDYPHPHHFASDEEDASMDSAKDGTPPDDEAQRS